MTYYQELIKNIEKVKEILTEETWDKSAWYFSIDKNNILCMDISGAIQTQINPQVKKVYEQYLKKEISAATARQRAARSETAAAGAAFAAAGPAAARRGTGSGRAVLARAAVRAAAKDFSDLFDLWVNRADWIKEDYIYNNINYGNLDLHYLVGLTGLYYKFEEKPETTLSMIKDKLDETIKLIKKIEKYIVYA